LNSIGIFSNNDKNLELDLHVNIKHTKKIKASRLNKDVLTKKKTDLDYLELGVKFKNNISKLSIYFPCQFTILDFDDKVGFLKNNNELVESLFNRHITENTEIDSNHSKLIIDDEEIIFVSLTSNNLKLKDVEGGVLLEIDTPQDDSFQNKLLYYRFRINKKLTFIDEEIFNSTAIDGNSNSRALISLNINQIRKLPSLIREDLSGEKILKSTTVFLLTDKNTHIQFLNENISILILENNIWNEYIEVNEEDKIIAYRWNTNNNINNKYRLFFKIGHKEQKISTFSLVLLIILIGALGGIIGNYFTTTIFNNFQDFQQWRSILESFFCNIYNFLYNKDS
jgi:hypothetical protein